MTAIARVRIDAVREALRAEDVISHYSLRAQRQGAKYRLPECPRCGAKSSSWAISINTRKGTWGHYGHGKNEGGACYGDLIDLVAACEGLERRSQWRLVIARCAAIAGVSPNMTDEEHDRIIAARSARARRLAAEEAQADRLRRACAAEEWASLRRDHDAGSRYLASRGLDDGALIRRDLVRFDAAGNVCVQLFGFDGELVTVTRRLLAPPAHDLGRKCHTPVGGTTRGTLCARVQAIGSERSVYITEGIADTLTACLVWPDAVVLGAAGAGQLRPIAQAAAPIVRATRGQLTLVPHNDENEVGQRCVVLAGEDAIKAGLIFERDLHVLEVRPHKDLNDAHRAGWTCPR